MDLAKDTKTTVCSTGEGASVFDEAGKLLNNEKANKISELVWGIISDAFKYSNESSSSIPPNRSLKDFFIHQIGEKDPSDVDKELILQMAEMWGAFVGSPWEGQSLKYFWLEECIDGGKLNTYYHTADRMIVSHHLDAIFLRHWSVYGRCESTDKEQKTSLWQAPTKLSSTA